MCKMVLSYSQRQRSANGGEPERHLVPGTGGQTEKICRISERNTKHDKRRKSVKGNGRADAPGTGVAETGETGQISETLCREKGVPSAGIVSHRAGAAGRWNLLGAELFRRFVLLGQSLGRIRDEHFARYRADAGAAFDRHRAVVLPGSKVDRLYLLTDREVLLQQ